MPYPVTPEFARRDARAGLWHIRRGMDDSAPGAESDAPLNIGLLIPASGAAGLWGPSCLACATLAAETWNREGGCRGRGVRLVAIDASDESADLERDLACLLANEGVDAFVGMTTSSVRQRIARTVRGRLPFVYTPLYEGGALPTGVFAIGETPRQQLLPALRWLAERFRLRRWYLAGNDYVWPRRSHALATRTLADAGCSVVGSRHVPIGRVDVDCMIDEIRRSRAQAVLLSLVGQDAVDFNRAFGDAGLAGRVLRLSCAIEENGMLATGPHGTDGLFVASGYFATLDTIANATFKERYHTRFGERAPVLNALGQSTYEGVSFLRGWMEHRRTDDAEVPFHSVRATRWRANGRKSTPIYLAEADGMRLAVTHRIAPHAIVATSGPYGPL
jgi:urea transport system substrate-binding protein